jgi:hypothetical protein
LFFTHLQHYVEREKGNQDSSSQYLFHAPLEHSWPGSVIRGKLRAYSLIQREGRHYAYCLTHKGVKVAVLFVLFHQRLCGPLTPHSFITGRTALLFPNTRLEAAFHTADNSIRKIIEVLEAA